MQPTLLFDPIAVHNANVYTYLHTKTYFKVAKYKLMFLNIDMVNKLLFVNTFYFIHTEIFLSNFPV